MKQTIRAGILAIGTEVSNGQINNSNSSWLANELINLCIEPAWHMAVADIAQDIKDALDFLRSKCSIVLITGGLGPTSDDFTRDVVCEWMGDKLIFSDAAWTHIEERFASLGIKPPESNRKQCLFPSRAQILSNRKGTAHGFRFEHAGVLYFCLPGPPEEIKAIWQDNIVSELKTMAGEQDEIKLLRWQCMGISESALGEMVEKEIEGSSLLAGYRPHLPYVEIKIWCAAAKLASEQTVLDRLDMALQRWTVSRDDEDCMDSLLALFKNYESIFIEDAATAGTLAQRIGKKWFVSHPKLTVKDSFSQATEERASPNERSLHLKIGPLAEDGSWQITWRTHDLHKSLNLKLPYKRNPQRMDRERMYVCEMSLAGWMRMLPSGELLA